MIPLELRVRNFLCYRDDVPPLSFEGIHLACLTGGNGHGKSALLDAITWAVWGEARSKHDDELIHQGQGEMEVEFTFELGGAAYRVLRKRESKKPGRTLLDFQVQHSAGWRSLAGNTVRATQAAIIRLLRMDYATFTNSAFLLQGKADAFTTRTPAERKQVLGDILGLSLYDEYEQRAKDRARAASGELDLLDARLRGIDAELAHRPEHEAALARAEGRVAELGSAVREAESGLRELQAALQALERQQALLQNLERRLAQTERELGEIADRIRERRAHLRAYEQALAERREIEEGLAALTAARRADAAWNERLARTRQVETRQRDAERAVAGARQELELAAGRRAEQIRGLEKRAGDAPRLEGELAEARSRLVRLAQRQEERDGARDRLQALEVEASALKARNSQLHADMLDLREKLDLLQAESGQATCPLCGQALTDEHRQELAAEYQAMGASQGDQHRANDLRLRAIAGEAQLLGQTVQQIERELAGQAAAQGRHAQLEHALQDAQQAAEELVPARSELGALQARLKSGEYALGDQQELARLAAELAEIGYDAQAHQAARDEAAALASFEARHQQLLLAGQQAESEKAALEELNARHARWTATLAAEREQRDGLATEVAALPGLSQQVRASAAELDEWQKQLHQAQQEWGAARQQVTYAAQVAEERVRVAGEHQRLAAEKADLEELRLAFGKKGIQAMIIEAAIPEIELEANRLLARMTEGRMQVRLETQRLTKQGDTLETLEITISDELGTRPYELFSGGETFRVNLAIRIALSKLLARRAGAQLQMLVIDEGFGTQDAEGRERLVEAVHSIQDDFERILVITHIDELKDAFPVRIEVTKTEQGSQYRLN